MEGFSERAGGDSRTEEGASLGTGTASDGGEDGSR